MKRDTGYYWIRIQALSEPEVALFDDGDWYRIMFFPGNTPFDVLSEKLELPAVQSRPNCNERKGGGMSGPRSSKLQHAVGHYAGSPGHAYYQPFIACNCGWSIRDETWAAVGKAFDGHLGAKS